MLGLPQRYADPESYIFALDLQLVSSGKHYLTASFSLHNKWLGPWLILHKNSTWNYEYLILQVEQDSTELNCNDHFQGHIEKAGHVFGYHWCMLSTATVISTWIRVRNRNKPANQSSTRIRIFTVYLILPVNVTTTASTSFYRFY
jgi:hypothetical protein